MRCRTILCVAALGVSGAALAGVGQESTISKLGVALIPRNFPHSTPADVDDAFRLTARTGTYTTFTYQWHELDTRVASFVLERAKRAGLFPIVSLSPTTLDQQRKELDIPADVRKRAGGNLSFANPVIRDAFRSTVRELARLKPRYLCLATEINLLALQRLPEYLQFATLYKDAYHDVKRLSPDTKVFVSFQWEWTRILDDSEPDKIDEHTKVIDILRPELDAVAFTSYPALFYNTPEELSPRYYSSMDRHVRRSDEVLFAEIGWPSEGKGTESQQVAFIQRLPELLRGTNVSVIVWALLHDVDVPAFGVNLNTVGLLTTRGREKPAYAAFKAMRLPPND